MWPVPRAQRSRRAFDPPAIPRLTESHPEWGELHEYQENEGGQRRQQRDE
jgi:hypothetical protein